MSSRATNAALKDRRDEAAILLDCYGNPLMSGGEQSTQAPNQLERWREMTAWVVQGGSVVIFNEEAKHIPAETNGCLYETIEEIKQLASLEKDWNDEGAPAIDRASILRAQKFVQWLACEAEEQQLKGDCAPAIFPTINGGVKLYWQATGRQVALTFSPGQDTIDAMEKALGALVTHRALSENAAGAVALEAMRQAM